MFSIDSKGKSWLEEGSQLGPNEGKKKKKKKWKHFLIIIKLPFNHQDLDSPDQIQNIISYFPPIFSLFSYFAVQIYYVRINCHWHCYEADAFFRCWRKQDGKKLPYRKMPFKCQSKTFFFHFLFSFFLTAIRAALAVPTTTMTNQIRDLREGGVCDAKSEKLELGHDLRIQIRRRKEERKEKGFWQIDCHAETEMAQKHHKNKFAIIHSDSELRENWKYFEETQIVSVVGGAIRRRKIYIWFFSSFFCFFEKKIKKCFILFVSAVV